MNIDRDLLKKQYDWVLEQRPLNNQHDIKEDGYRNWVHYIQTHKSTQEGLLNLLEYLMDVSVSVPHDGQGHVS